ncbi:carboxypeptidase-like regulatory domain-containing protein [Sinomicrobium weinanense]|uniref:Carboxypeptidase-like regulatory domain-containing protein n=1 Tax=Sinomicrobium weinanense TaxID=2842200 RepID=A0A926JUC7_9FLAO|nr:carboxypeptidase-like regulatory domain-containing protein [Sinomicrobium weinanense]MBC9797539.1 carboxypeptidase-like regulatory domain-containing protein [Sinomicrobium weinanense]MBU3122398.1 carboxypeptidase-like regulatory domain-containing protein [Sinomicrobium weinanense]
MKLFYLVLAVFICGVPHTVAQRSVTARVIDSASQKPIPFATVSVNKSIGVISSESGDFTLHLKDQLDKDDSLYISCLGYKEKTIQLIGFKDSLIALKPKIIELDEVFLLNKNYTVDEIIAHVKDSLEKNYDFDMLKQKLFFRKSDYSYIDKKEATLTKSSIPEFNQAFVDSLLYAVPDRNSDHTEFLGEFYGKVTPDDPNTKLHIIKASRLYDKDNEMSVNALTDKLQRIIRAHVKRDSYFKVKSGWIGTKTEIDSSLFGDDKAREAEAVIEERQKQEEERKKQFLQYEKRSLAKLQHHNFIFKKSDLNFIHKNRKYEFKLENITTLHDYIVYKISFQPRHGADYKGTLYVNADDFAVIRADYENVKPIQKFSLLGVSYNEHLQEGTLLYEKNSRDKYALKYIEEKHGRKVGFKRPIKIIEKNKHVKGRRKQNEVAGDVHLILGYNDKSEMIVFESDVINESDFERYKEEPGVVPQYLSEYDPSFWEGYNIIEPNAAIKEFKSVEN